MQNAKYKLNLTLKDYSSKSIVKYLTYDWLLDKCGPNLLQR
jgi:hypothetical protein